MNDDDKKVQVQTLIKRGKWIEAANVINDEIDEEFRYILIKTAIREAYNSGQREADEVSTKYPRVEGS